MATISVSIIAHNEEKNIEDCLKSVNWVDEIIVVDCESNDKTLEIAKKYTSKIFHRENINNLNINKSYGFEKATSDWILYIDADERVSDDLMLEIKEIINNNTKYSAYRIPRKNYYFGRWLKYGGNYPDYQIRLFQRGKGKFECKHVHEKLKIDGKIGYLSKPITHYPYKTISEYLSKFNFYTTFEAEFLSKKFKKHNYIITLNYLFFKPLSRFFRRYFFKLGFLDGIPGLLSCLFDSANIIVSYAKYWEKIKSEK